MAELPKMPECKFKQLRDPFPDYDVEWRVQSCGDKNGKPWAMVLAYITARGVQERLDRVIGPENWKVKYRHEGKGVMAELSLKIDGEWIAKEDGAEETDVEAFKGGMSGALKRAAVVWGIGRYLYRLENNFANIVPKGTKGARNAKTKNGVWFSWTPPIMPDWARAKDE